MQSGLLDSRQFVLGVGPGGWLREITVNDANPGLTITQAGAGAALRLAAGHMVIAAGETIELHNLADEVTNYERLRAYWSSNIIYIKTEKGGTGTARHIEINSAQGAYGQFAVNLGLFTGTSGNFYFTGDGAVYIRDLDAINTIKASILTATGYARFGDSTSPTVSLEAANGLDIVAGNLTMAASAQIQGDGTGATGIVLKNPKNAAASALSGTQLDVEIDIGGVPYHFTVYPTKAV